MSTYVNRDFVTGVMKSQGRNLFKVKDSGQGVLVYNDDITLPLDEAINQVESCLDNLTSGWVLIELHHAKNKGQAGGKTFPTLQYKVKVDSTAHNSAITGTPAHTSLDWPQLFIAQMKENNQLHLQLIQQQHQHAIEGITGQDSNAQLKQTALETLAGLIIAEYAKHNKAPMAPPAPGIHGTEDHQQPIPNEDQKKRLSTAIRKFKQIDENWLDNLEYLANYAAQNPAMYRGFLNTLKGGK